MASVTLSSVKGQPRRQIVRLTSSNSAVPIPSWAQGGKGICYVTGCGGGGGGGVVISTTNRASGGNSAACVVNAPMEIAAGVTTVSVVIGAAGAGITSQVGGYGGDGGASSVTIGASLLTIEGGAGGNNTTASRVLYAKSYFGPIDTTLTVRLDQTPYSDNTSKSTLAAGASMFVGGSFGGHGGQMSAGYGAGGYSLFGNGGPGVASVTGTRHGGSAGGYGAGGAGASTDSATAGTSGNGSPGMVILEFVEGF